jgi:FkbM family methyltransferase
MERLARLKQSWNAQQRTPRLFSEPDLAHVWRDHPLVLVDVGARGGLPPHWQAVDRFIKVIGFEPDQRSFDSLGQRQNVTYLKVGLSAEKGTIPLFLTRDAGDSSVFRPNQALLAKFPRAERFDVVGTTTMAVDTLDNQLREHAIDDVDFIKIDTQGSELAILSGAPRTLAAAVCGLELEVEFCPIYEEQPLFADVDRHVSALGFRLFDLKPTYWKREAGRTAGGEKGQMVFADALYLRDFSVLRNALEGSAGDRKALSKVYRYLGVCAVYGYHDYALDILETARDLFPRSEFELLERRLRSSANRHRRVPNFRGRAQLARLLKQLGNLLSVPNSLGIHGGGSSRLGNRE